MWITEPSRINDRIEFLGTYELCFYLVRGEVGMIVGGGMIHAQPSLEAQLSAAGVAADDVHFIVVTHSHFDHCGALPYLRDRFPNARVIGTEAARETLTREKIVAYNAKMNDRAAEQAGVGSSCIRVQERPELLSIDMVVKDGDSIDLGEGITAEFYEVPGHSKCCLATYIPQMRALFPTDTMPHPVSSPQDLSYPSAQYDFAKYVASLRRLNDFDVDILALDHHGVMLHEQATEYMRLGLKRTLDFQKFVLDRYAETHDVELVSREATAMAFPTVRLPFITEDLMFVITRAMIKSILGLK